MDPVPRRAQWQSQRGALPWREVVRRLLVHARCLGAAVEEAEDLVHDTLEVMVSEPERVDFERDVLSWLKVVLRNRWLNRIRAESVSERARPRLYLAQSPRALPDAPLTAEEARAHRLQLLSLLEPEERAVFGAWIKQRAGTQQATAAASSLGMTVQAFEAAKKRLRRRCQAILGELGIEACDLFDPSQGGL